MYVSEPASMHGEGLEVFGAITPLALPFLTTQETTYSIDVLLALYAIH
jgi:hypothetical protein